MAVGKLPSWIVVMVIYFATANSEDNTLTDNKTVASVERLLLNSLGIPRKPRINKDNVHIPSHMLHLYNLQMLKNKQRPEKELNSVYPDDIFANTVRSFPHKDSAEDKLQDHYTMILQFNISTIPANEVIREIELRITHIASSNEIPPSIENKKLTKDDLKYLQRLRVYDIIRPSEDKNSAIYRLLDTNIVDSRKSGTVKFDVAPAVKRWLKNRKANHGFLLEVTPLKKEIFVHRTGSHLRLKREVYSDPEHKDELPILLIHSDDPPKPREKRDIPYKKYNHCQRHRLYVDFKRVEWNTWIVAPIGYDAYFCHGECRFPLSDSMNATNHAVVQTLVHSKYPSRVPSACCVPTTHTAMSMLYVDDDKHVVLKTYQEMVVEACGCR